MNACQQSFGPARPDALVAIDTSGRILSWESDAEALFGWRADDVRGRRVQELLLHASAPGVLEQFRTDAPANRPLPHVPSASRAVVLSAAAGSVETGLYVEPSRICADTLLLFFYVTDAAACPDVVSRHGRYAGAALPARARA
jgi:hypothetical protein